MIGPETDIATQPVTALEETTRPIDVGSFHEHGHVRVAGRKVLTIEFEEPVPATHSANDKADSMNLLKKWHGGSGAV